MNTIEHIGVTRAADLAAPYSIPHCPRPCPAPYLLL